MSLALAQTLVEKRANIASQMRELVDNPAGTGGELSTEQEQTFVRMGEEVDALAGRIKQYEETEARMASAEKAMKSTGIIPAQRTAVDDRNPATSDVALRDWLGGQNEFVNQRGFDLAPTEDQRTELRTLTKGSATAGGNLVPTGFYNTLVQHMIEVSSIMHAGPTILNTSTGEALQIPKTTGFSSAAIVSEGGTIAASDPTFGQITLGAYKYGWLGQVSHELANDSAFDLQGFLASEVGRAMGNAFGAHLVNGTGTGQPTGAVTQATTGVTGGTGVGGAFTADNLIDLFYSVIYPYRNSPSCAWLMRDATVATVRKFKDTTNQYIWQPSIQVGAPDTLLGKPLYTEPNMPAVGLNNKPVVFGDWSRYFVRTVEGLRFERSDEFAFNTDLISYRALWRGDGNLIDTTGALKCFVGGAS